MRTPFFITGLPRTRTAWLANLFTTDSTVCFHEPVESVVDLVRDNPDVRIGIADSTLPLKSEAILAKWPAARWLYVRRNPDDAQRSLLKFARGHYPLMGRQVKAYFDMHAAAAARTLGGAVIMMMDFEDLDDPSAVRQAWEHLLPGVRLHPMRLQVLMKLNVQQDLSKRMHELPRFLMR